MKYYINDATQKPVGTHLLTSPVHLLYDTEEEAAAVVLDPTYLTNRLRAWQYNAVVLSEAQRGKVSELLKLLSDIHRELDAAEWDSQTMQNVAELLTAHGLPVRDYDPGEGICISCGEPETAHDANCPAKGLTCLHCGHAHHHDQCPGKSTEV